MLATGCALSKRIDHKLTLAVLRMAIALRNPAPGIIHHSDRGVQYACAGKYVKELEDHRFTISMSLTKRGVWRNQAIRERLTPPEEFSDNPKSGGSLFWDTQYETI
jgi:transposase InsO family protein